MRISREELYQLVSSTPLSKLAPSFGITGTTLAALCRRHEVPYPGSGYWTRVALGMPVELRPLPIATDEVAIEFEPHRPKRISQVEKPLDEALPSEVEAKLEEPHRSKEQPPKKRPSQLHPIVRDWLAQHERRRLEARTSRGSLWGSPAPPPLSGLDHRRHQFCDALFRALEDRGATLEQVPKGGIAANIGGETIKFTVREKMRQVKHPAGVGGYSYARTELVGTEGLVLCFDTYLRGTHHEQINETLASSLEDRIPRIVDRFIKGAAILRDWHEEQEREKERWRQAAARRAELERLAKVEEIRRQALFRLSEDFEKAQRIRAMMAALRSSAPCGAAEIGGRSLDDWFMWAEAVAAELDASAGGADALFGRIAEVKVDRSPWG